MNDTHQPTAQGEAFTIYSTIRYMEPGEQCDLKRKEPGAIAFAMTINSLLCFVTIELESTNDSVRNVMGYVSFVLFLVSLVFFVNSLISNENRQKLMAHLEKWAWSHRILLYFISLLFFVISISLSLYLIFFRSQEIPDQLLVMFAIALLVVAGRRFVRAIGYGKDARFKEGIFSDSLHPTRILIPEIARRLNEFGFILTFTTFPIALIFSFSTSQANAEWQTAVSMISGSFLGLLLSQFWKESGTKEKLQETLGQGCRCLRDIELTAQIASEDTLEVIRSIERYLAWTGTFRHGKNRDLVITVDRLSTELWLLLRETISGKSYKSKLLEDYSDKISGIQKGTDKKQLVTLAGGFARDLRNCLEKSKFLDS